MAVQSGGYRGTLIRLVTFLGGLYFFFEFVLPGSVLEATGIKDRHEAISNGFIVVGTMALGLGLVSLLSFHGGRVVFRRKGWVTSLVLVSSLLLSLSVTALTWLENLGVSSEIRKTTVLAEYTAKYSKNELAGAPSVQDPVARLKLFASAVSRRHATIETDLAVSPSSKDEEALATDVRTGLTASQASLTTLSARLDRGELPSAELEAMAAPLNDLGARHGKLLKIRLESSWASKLYSLINDGLMVPLGSAMFSLLGLYIAAAAYRAFRIRSIESSLMMVAAILVMLGQISFGEWIYDGMPGIRQWLLEVPNSAAFRAIRIGAALAALLLGIRMWLSIESKSFSRDAK